jgi:nicotinamidase-related amidase
MRQVLLVVDVQPCFDPPQSLVDAITRYAVGLPSIATVERHDEAITPFARQLGWQPAADDQPLIPTDALFVKHGYLPPPALIDHLKQRGIQQVLVCGLQTDTCCLAAGFLLFDAGLHPTLLQWLSVGSSLDRSGALGAQLWRHHFGQHSVIASPTALAR